MKRVIFILIVFAALMFQTNAQTNMDLKSFDRVPFVTATIPGSELPDAVSKAVNTRFDKDNPFTWSKFPYELKEYGWVYEVGSSDNNALAGFEVTMKTSNGNTHRGLYNVDGKLIESREVSKNIPIPRYIMEALASSEYSDWKIVGDREIVQFYNSGEKPSADQYFKLTLQKEKTKRKIAFKYEANTGKYQAIVMK